MAVRAGNPGHRPLPAGERWDRHDVGRETARVVARPFGQFKNPRVPPRCLVVSEQRSPLLRRAGMWSSRPWKGNPGSPTAHPGTTVPGRRVGTCGHRTTTTRRIPQARHTFRSRHGVPGVFCRADRSIPRSWPVRQHSNHPARPGRRWESACFSRRSCMHLPVGFSCGSCAPAAGAVEPTSEKARAVVLDAVLHRLGLAP